MSRSSGSHRVDRDPQPNYIALVPAGSGRPDTRCPAQTAVAARPTNARRSDSNTSCPVPSDPIDPAARCFTLTGRILEERSPIRNGSGAKATLVLLVRHGRTATTGVTLPGRARGLHLADAGRKE